MLTALGVILAASAILASISLHEAGHLVAAKVLGMRVTQYFVGFGPTLWSFRRGETEYGLRAIPLGGFVKIAGMAAQDEEADDPRAMWRFPVWKRTIVMAAGSAVHFILAFLIFWGIAATVTVPNPANAGPFVLKDQVLSQPAFVRVASCVDADLNAARKCAGDDGPGKLAGLRDGDRITRLGDRSITTYGDLVSAIRSLPTGQPVPVDYLRNGTTTHTTIRPVSGMRPPADNPRGAPIPVVVMGLGLGFDPALPETSRYNAIEAVPVAGSWVGEICSAVVTSVKNAPEKISGLWASITGGNRDPESPVSVVGASRISGELFSIGDYVSVLSIIAALNIFIGLFNMLPLLPLDGGHIAVAWFQRLRSWLYARLRKPSPSAVNPAKSMPLTYTGALILGAFTLLTVTADILNPISIVK